MKTVIIDGVEFISKEDCELQKAKEFKGMEYSIIRTYSAGVFAGYIAKRDGQEVEIKQSRRLWYWDGAASLSQLAVDGVSKPQNCKFPTPVESQIVTQAIEIIPCTAKAQKSIEGVPIWKS